MSAKDDYPVLQTFGAGHKALAELDRLRDRLGRIEAECKKESRFWSINPIGEPHFVKVVRRIMEEG